MLQQNLPIQILSAKLTDAGRISKLIQPLVRTYISHEYSAEGETTILNATNQSALARYLTGDYHYRMALVSSAGKSILAGVLGIKADNHIYHLFVSEEFHQQGIAKALWHDLLRHSKALEFTVNSSRYAVEFYQHLGFTRKTERFEKNGIRCYPMVFRRPVTVKPEKVN